MKHSQRGGCFSAPKSLFTRDYTIIKNDFSLVESFSVVLHPKYPIRFYSITHDNLFSPMRGERTGVITENTSANQI